MDCKAEAPDLEEDDNSTAHSSGHESAVPCSTPSSTNTPTTTTSTSSTNSTMELNSIMINAHKRLSTLTGQTIKAKTAAVFEPPIGNGKEVPPKKPRKPRPPKKDKQQKPSDSSSGRSSTGTPSSNSNATIQHTPITAYNPGPAPPPPLIPSSMPTPSSVPSSIGPIYIGHNALGQLTGLTGFQSGHLVLGPGGSPVGIVAPVPFSMNSQTNPMNQYPPIQPAPSYQPTNQYVQSNSQPISRPPSNIMRPRATSAGNISSRPLCYPPPIVINPHNVSASPEKPGVAVRPNTPVGSVISAAISSTNASAMDLPPPPPPISSANIPNMSPIKPNSSAIITSTNMVPSAQAPLMTHSMGPTIMPARMPMPAPFQQMQFGGGQIFQTPQGLFACAPRMTVIDDGRGCLYQVVPQGIVGLRLPSPFVPSSMTHNNSSGYMLPNGFASRPLLPAPVLPNPKPDPCNAVTDAMQTPNIQSRPPIVQSLAPSSMSSTPDIVELKQDNTKMDVKSETISTDLPPPLMIGAVGGPGNESDIRSLFMEEVERNCMAKPGAISHVIDGFIIQESSDPFTIAPFPFDCIPPEAYMTGPHNMMSNSFCVPPPDLDQEGGSAFHTYIPSPDPNLLVTPFSSPEKGPFSPPGASRGEEGSPLFLRLPPESQKADSHKECLHCGTDMAVFGSYDKSPNFCKKFCYKEFGKGKETSPRKRKRSEREEEKPKKSRNSRESKDEEQEETDSNESNEDTTKSRRKSQRKNSHGGKKENDQSRGTKRRTTAPKRYSDPCSSLVPSADQLEEGRNSQLSASPRDKVRRLSQMTIELENGYSNSETPASLFDPQNLTNQEPPVMTSPMTSPPPNPLHNVPTGDPRQWTMQEVESWLISQGGTVAQCVATFTEQEIDGQALVLLSDQHMMAHLKIKLGPAVKINKALVDLRRSFAIQEPK